MKPKLLLAPAVLLSLTLAGCTNGLQVSSNSPPAPDAAVSQQGNTATENVAAQAEEGQDVGNSRPVVSYDGLMVRRRVVIAVDSEMDADLAGLRTKLETAAAPQGMALADISPDVLEPAVLEHLMPELIVALPAAATLDDGRAVVIEASGADTETLGVRGFHVLQTLVHDLRFTIATTNPGPLAAAIDREGILSDALGNYRTTTANGKLSFSYTGPLLGDDIVESVRDGIARQSHSAASTVVVEPESADGTGVNMATEPPWKPKTLEEGHGLAHG